MNLSFKHIEPFLSSPQNKAAKWFSYFGLGIGVLLLLCSVQMYININQLLKNKNPKQDGYDYISITKKITDDNAQKEHSFTNDELKNLKQQKFITDISPLVSNKFVIKATGGSMLPFSTDFFVEALDKSFIDTVPGNFTWKEGDNFVPVIISSDYLELYNAVFAPSRDLPSFSPNTVSTIKVELECSAGLESYTYKASVVALSDRINSVLVPKTFLEWANKNIGGIQSFQPSRIFLKTRDANNPDLLKFLEQKDYYINKDKTKFGRIKQILQAIVTGLAVFGVLVILLAMILFSFYLQLMIARSKENLLLLLQIGYSPNWLAKTVAKKWIPVYSIIIVTALIVTAIFQWIFATLVMKNSEALSPIIHWITAAVAVVLLIISIAVNQRLIKKLVNKL